ncbi:MAG: hypothetical protein QXU20_01085, partial [Candidatus Woesearchaeota archaeon]
AARIALEAGMRDKAEELYKKAIEVKEKKGDFYSAAEIALEAGLPDEAIEFYEKKGDFGKAADTASKTGRVEKAKNLRILIDLINK